MDPTTVADHADVELIGGCSGHPEQTPPWGSQPFVAGPENRLLGPAVRAVCEAPGRCYNPLVLYGPSGAGKTRLVEVALDAWQRRHGSRAVRRLSGAAFVRELADAIDAQATEVFRQRYRRAALLVLEDVEGIANSQAAQIELVHTLDALLAEEHQVVVTARAAPQALSGMLPALAGRLVGGLVLGVSPAGFEARLVFVRRWAAENRLRLPESTARLLAERAGDDVPELERVLGELKADGRSARTLSDAAIRRRLGRRDPSQPSVPQIAAATAREFCLKVADLRSRSRRQAVVQARAVAMFLARQLTSESLSRIGRYFGGRDHTTVLHGCRRTAGLLGSRPALRRAVDRITQRLRSAGPCAGGGRAHVEKVPTRRQSTVERRPLPHNAPGCCSTGQQPPDAG